MTRSNRSASERMWHPVWPWAQIGAPLTWHSRERSSKHTKIMRTTDTGRETEKEREGKRETEREREGKGETEREAEMQIEQY